MNNNQLIMQAVKKALAASKTYTNEVVVGGGAIKGKNCVITSIDPITGGQRVNFQWTLDNGTVQTAYMDVMDGEDGTQVYADVSHLPVLTSTDRAVYYVEDEACFYFWDGTQWIAQQADISALTQEQINNLISLL